MNITDATFYQRGNKFIPNINNLNAEIEGVPNEGNELEYFIGKIERLFIISLLGIEEAELLQVAIDDLINADQKYINLLKGVNYTKDGETYRFDGLRGNNKESLIAYYVFCKYLENDESTYSTTGIVKSTTRSAEYFSPSRKYLDCWHQFLCMYQDETSTNEPIIYESNGMIGIDYYGRKKRKGGLVTLETYLNDHKEDFPNFHIERYETKNSLGI